MLILLLLFQEWHPGSLFTYGNAQYMQAENLQTTNRNMYSYFKSLIQGMLFSWPRMGALNVWTTYRKGQR